MEVILQVSCSFRTLSKSRNDDVQFRPGDLFYIYGSGQVFYNTDLSLCACSITWTPQKEKLEAL
ncbi:hypothetical protein C0J52_22267 [Blattella germanica]|nr:hypothetical protein C0J52_22267 [Blattella germanica]